jgi:hypothetical protein
MWINILARRAHGWFGTEAGIMSAERLGAELTDQLGKVYGH